MVKYGGMVGKTYKIKEEDEIKLISYILRFKQIATYIDETHDRLQVYTAFLSTDTKATSSIAGFDLIKVSDESAKMTKEEAKVWLEGEWPEKP